MEHNIRMMCQKSVISPNGGAFKYVHLITPNRMNGLETSLIDIWANTVATLASHADVDKIQTGSVTRKGNGVYSAHVPGKVHRTSFDPDTPYVYDGREWNGLTVGDHQDSAMLDAQLDLRRA